MRKLLVSLGAVDYSASLTTGAWDIDSLTDGGLAAFESGGTTDGQVIDGVAPVITANYVYFAVNRTGSNPTMSIPIYRGNVTYSKEVYSAPAAKVMCIGDDNTNTYDLNLPTAAEGNILRVRLINLELPEYDTSRETVVDYVMTSSDTNYTASAAFIVKFNLAATQTLVTAAAIDAGTANEGITFTADTAGANFTVLPEEDLANAPLLSYKMKDGTYDGSYTTFAANDYGQGTSAQVLAIEKEYSSQDGNIGSNLLAADLWKVTSLVVTGATYTVYTIMFTNPDDDVLVREDNMTPTLIIAVPSGETGAAEAVTAMDNILAAI